MYILSASWEYKVNNLESMSYWFVFYLNESFHINFSSNLCFC